MTIQTSRRTLDLTLPLMRYKHIVDSSKLCVYLQTQVGQCLRGRFHHVLYLNTLSGHAKKRVTNPLYFSCDRKVRQWFQLPNSQ